MDENIWIIYIYIYIIYKVFVAIYKFFYFSTLISLYIGVNKKIIEEIKAGNMKNIYENW